MDTPHWTWAHLDQDTLDRVAEAERLLNAGYLMVFEPAAELTTDVEDHLATVQPTPLTESQLECVQGLEQQLNAVVVVYTDK